MSLAALLVALLLPAAAAWRLLDLALGPVRPQPLEVGERVAAAAVLGLGCASLLAMGWLLAGGALDRSYALADAAVMALVGLGALVRGRARWPGGPASPPAPPALPALPASQVAVALLWVALVAAGVAMAQASAHGGWDAVAIWNQRARFIYRAAGAWREAFSPQMAWSQLDYPPGLPLMVARAFAYAGDTTAAPRAIATVFALAGPAILGGAAARRGGPLAGGVAALLLLATPGWLQTAALQYADVPVATYLLLGVAWLGAAPGPLAAPGVALAGGLALGLAGFTKNEGLAGAVWASLAWCALCWRGPDRSALPRRLGRLVAGAALPAIAWLAFHWSVSPAILPAFTSGAGSAGLLTRGLDPSRWWLILGHAPGACPGADLWLPLVALVLAGLLGARPGGAARSLPLATSAAMVLGVLAMFAVTPHPLAWHLSTSMSRLLLHPWPLALLALFGAVRPRAQACSGGSPTA